MLLADSVQQPVIKGSVRWNAVVDTETSDITADLTTLAWAPKAVYSSKNPSPIVGSYTVLIPGQPGWGVDEPGGDGWATVKISKTGAVKLAGRLGDGTSITEAAYLSAGAEFQLYRDLYRTTPEKGRFGGRVVFDEHIGVSQFHGEMDWIKFQDGREKQYANGFKLKANLLGSLFTAAPAKTRVLNDAGLAVTGTAQLSLFGPNLPSSTGQLIERTVDWSTNNKLVYGVKGGEQITATIKAKTGQLSGSYVDPVTKLKVKFTGVVFQAQQLVAGQYVLDFGTGVVRIIPNAAAESEPETPAP